MSFPKFVSLLKDGLFFSRVDRLGDEWECAFPRGLIALFDGAKAEIAEVGGSSRRADDAVALWRTYYPTAATQLFASCWHMGTNEDPWMWKVYGSDEFAVAVCSTYEKMYAALPWEVTACPIKMGQVRYGDYDSPDYSIESDPIAIAMSKRSVFANENEVRVLCDRAATLGKETLGFTVAVDLNKLATRVIVSPRSPEWFLGAVETICRIWACDLPVGHSELRRKPPVPF